MPIQPYNEVDYENLPSNETPLSAENLNKTDDQVSFLTELFREMEFAMGGEFVTDFTKLVTNPQFNYIDLVVGAVAAYQRGRISYSDTDDTLTIHHKNGVMQQVGEELYATVTNATGTTITEGTLVGLTGSGTIVSRYLADGSTPPIYAIGIATENIVNGARGRLTVYGRVRGIDTSAFTSGIIYASPTVPGGLTQTKPTVPNLALEIGVVTVVSATAGEIFVRPVLSPQMYYGNFARVSDATLTAANTATPIQFDFSGIANGVSIDPLNTSHVKIEHSGLYSFNFSCQLASTNASLKNVKIWLAVNGTPVANSTMRRAVETGTAVTVQTRVTELPLSAGDYVQVIWASDNTTVILDHIDADVAAPFAPATPAATLQVTQQQQ